MGLFDAVDNIFDQVHAAQNKTSTAGAAKSHGQGSPAVPPALTDVPSPLDDPFLWIQVGLGPFAWPLTQGNGTAIVSCESSQKLDEQKAGGKDKAKMKQSGTDPCPVDIELTWLPQFWPFVQAMLNGIDPNGPSRGGPFEIRHPEPNRRNVNSVMIKKVGKVQWVGGAGLGKCTINAVEWQQPKKAQAGVGTKTPKSSQQWVATGNKGTPIDSSGRVQATEEQILNSVGLGLDGPNSPDYRPH